jgi:hypothetical protein
MAAGLAASENPTAAAEEARRQLVHASPPVRDVLRRLPPPARAKSELAMLMSDIHTKLAGE